MSMNSYFNWVYTGKKITVKIWEMAKTICRYWVIIAPCRRTDSFLTKVVSKNAKKWLLFIFLERDEEASSREKGGGGDPTMLDVTLWILVLKHGQPVVVMQVTRCTCPSSSASQDPCGQLCRPTRSPHYLHRQRSSCPNISYPLHNTRDSAIN